MCFYLETIKANMRVLSCNRLVEKSKKTFITSLEEKKKFKFVPYKNNPIRHLLTFSLLDKKSAQLEPPPP